MLMAPIRGPDAACLLVRALQARIGAIGAIVEQQATPWASATFIGTRHVLTICCRDPDGAVALAAMLPEAELALRGHLLADLTAAPDGNMLRIEALTLVEG